jgi:hypothetical protein
MTQMQQFDTGAKREVKKGKGRFDLISPIANARVSLVLEKGAEKHDARNWEQGMPLWSYYNSLLRHLSQWMEGETEEDHLAHARFNLDALMHTQTLIRLGELPEELLEQLPKRLYEKEIVYVRQSAEDSGGGGGERDSSTGKDS